MKKSKILTLITTFFIIIVTFTFLLKTNLNHKNHPNIIIITVDALRADHMSIYGYKYKTTPNIDKYFKTSAIFENAFCPVPKTSGSLASMLTGLHPFIHKTAPVRSKLNGKFLTLPEYLKQKGYTTVAIVDNSNLSKKYNFSQGFDKYIQVWEKIPSKEKSSEFITMRAINVLKKTHEKPIFLWVHYIETHTPYIPPEKFVKKRPKGRRITLIKHKIIANKYELLEMKKYSPYEGYFISKYDGAVEYVDYMIGKLLMNIPREIQNNLIIILSADHGEDLGDYNYFFDHGLIASPASTRIPLLIKGIKSLQNKRIKKPVTNMDIFPTIVSLIGEDPPLQFTGKSIFSLEKINRLIFIYAIKGFGVVSNNNYYMYTNEKIVRRLDIKKYYIYDLNNEWASFDIKKMRIKLLLYKKKYYKFFAKNPYPRKRKKRIKLSPSEIKSLKTLGYIN